VILSNPSELETTACTDALPRWKLLRGEECVQCSSRATVIKAPVAKGQPTGYPGDHEDAESKDRRLLRQRVPPSVRVSVSMVPAVVVANRRGSSCGHREAPHARSRGNRCPAQNARRLRARSFVTLVSPERTHGDRSATRFLNGGTGASLPIGPGPTGIASRVQPRPRASCLAEGGEFDLPNDQVDRGACERLPSPVELSYGRQDLPQLRMIR